MSKIVIYKITCPMCNEAAYEGRISLTSADVADGALKNIICAQCNEEFDYNVTVLK